MDAATIELMHEQVRTIYRAATGSDLNGNDAAPALVPTDREIEQRFAALEVLARQNPAVGGRVPPFSFTPLANVIDDGSDLVVEVAAPGVDASDLHVVSADHELRIWGIRRDEPLSEHRTYLHAEIPRGPFSRVLRLPCTVDPQPRVDVCSGVIVIRLEKR